MEKVQKAANTREKLMDPPLTLIFRGWALGQIEPRGAGAEMVRQGVTLWQDTLGNVDLPFLLFLLAETYERTRRIDSAQEVIAQALHIALANEEEAFLPELYRLQGRYLLAAGERVHAQTSFRHALALAQSQQAKSLELRAAVSLSQLLADLERPSEAHDLLAPIYDWFTEGFETVDLRAAQKLLLALAAR
jgi:predicted ATPase